MYNIMSIVSEGEHRYQEFKEKYSKSLLKTVSAFANNHNGKLVIGVSDKGAIVGVDNVADVRLSIENAINDGIRPRPYYEVTVLNSDHKDVIVFEIFKGDRSPYTFNNKAYERLDTSTVEIDRERYDELVLLGRNMSFEELSYESKESASKLEFKILESLLSKNLDIGKLDNNVLKSLQLIKDGRYTIAAALLADRNEFNRIGMDVIKYRDNTMMIIEDRSSLSKVSILQHFETCMNFYNRYIQQKDVIVGEQRTTFMQVPKTAYREALINAIVHRDYHKAANNRVEFFEDRIEILSVGGLPLGTTEEEYKKGSYSNLRNRIIADIFFRAGYIEKMGTGIRRIKKNYAEYGLTPKLEVMKNSIKVVLPFITVDDINKSKVDEINDIEGLSEELNKLVNYFAVNRVLSRKEVEAYMSVGKTKANELLKALVDKGLVIRRGSGRATEYILRD